jgi:hypothetical protein
MCDRQISACNFHSVAEGVREWSISQSGHINSMMIIYELPSIYLCDCTLFGRESTVPN